jgi:RNA polymerase sigma factor (sigma-70 family)
VTSNEELAVQAQQGDKNAEWQLWQQVERLVKKIALRRLPTDGSTNRTDIDDLMQAGYIAMLNAVKDFDPESGFMFTTYLSNHLKNAFSREQGIKTTRRDALLQAISMDAPLQVSEDMTLADTLTDHSESAFDRVVDNVATQQTYDIVMQYVNKLEPRQGNVIRLHYCSGLTFRQIADQINVSYERVHQIEQNGMRKLRAFPEIRKIGQELYADEHSNFFLHISIEAFQSGAGSAVENIAERRDRIFNNQPRTVFI